MSLFARLAAVTRRQNAEGELPDFIVPLLLRVAEHPADFAGCEDLVAQLAQQVEAYETFSDVSCEKIGFSLEDLRRTLHNLRIEG